MTMIRKCLNWFMDMGEYTLCYTNRFPKYGIYNVFYFLYAHSLLFLRWKSNPMLHYKVNIHVLYSSLTTRMNEYILDFSLTLVIIIVPNGTLSCLSRFNNFTSINNNFMLRHIWCLCVSFHLTYLLTLWRILKTSSTWMLLCYTSGTNNGQNIYV